MTQILDLGDKAVLGRLRSINRKNRLRAKHYEEVEWGDPLSIDVIDADALSSADHYPCLDRFFLVSKKLRDVIIGLNSEVEIQEIQAGDQIVYLVMPCSEEDVGYEAEGLSLIHI